MYLGGPVNSIKITLISLFIASSAYAEEIVKFVSLDACKVYYAKSVTPVAGETVDTYCKNRIMSFIEACTATKIAEYVTAQKLKAFTDLSDTEQRTKKATFTYQCQVTSQNEVAGNARNAANARAAASVGSAGGASNPSAAAAASAQQNVALAQMAVQLGQQGTRIIDNIDKATQKNAAGSQQPQQAATNGGGNTTTTTSNNSAPATAGKDTAAVKPADPSTAATPQPATTAAADTSAAAQSAAAPKVDDFSELSKESLDKYAQETAAAKEKLGSQAADVKKIDPNLGEKADGVSQKSDGSGAAAKDAQIAGEAKAATTELQSKVNAAATAAQPLGIQGGAPAFTQADQTVKDYKQQVESYYKNKETCKDAAEKAKFLCVEDTSPGAVAAKELMNAAGPVLAIISSAQKTCSSTAKVTKLVNTGLLVAKGVCVAAKVYCDVSCGKAKVDITKIGVGFKAKYTSAVQADYMKAQAQCKQYWAEAASDYGASTPLATACDADLASKQATAKSVGPQMQTALDTEANAAKPGTSPEIAVKCTSMAKDIALLAVQAAGTFAAYKNAEACAEKLAASGAGATAITTQQYCEKSENVSSQICVCQKNPTASGCPGAIVADSSSANSSADKGTNIKGVGGNSAFAGGFGTGKKPDFSSSNLGKDSINGALAGAASGDGSAGGLGGFGGGGLSGGGGGALGGVPASAAEAALKKEAEEKKKWSFGAFGSSDGGGGANGGTAGNKYKSGALTTGDQAAIQRQIASEKYAAEVSTASGKSNWEKIRNMYLIKENSFIFGQ
jgi:trimeric autotransporter adhesin